MVSEFRRKKIIRGFEFFDTDKSGTVEKADFELAAKRIAEKRGHQPGDEKHQQILDFLLKVWDGIQKKADKDGDGQVTADEWIEVFSEGTNEEWQLGLIQFIFRILDSGKDGVIDKTEFVNVITSFGRDKGEAETAYDKFSQGKASVSFDQFKDLWKEHFTSDDTNAPGNFIFGRVNF